MRTGRRFGSRSGEVVNTGKAAHHLLAKHVSFHSMAPALPVLASDGEGLRAAAEGVCSVRLEWPSSKTGPRVHYLDRSEAEDAELLGDLVEWCIGGQLKPEDPLFTSYRLGRRKVMTSRMLSAHIKTLAVAAGLAPESMGPKSMRVGRATEMSARGASKREIDDSVQWSTKSANSLAYTRAVPPGARQAGIQVEHLRVMAFSPGHIEAGRTPVHEERRRSYAASDGVPHNPVNR